MQTSKETYYISIDVGSTKVRAGIFELNYNEKLKLICRHELKIDAYNELENYFEQSSEDIWLKICVVVQQIIQLSGTNLQSIRGISFDATCSLVCLDKEFKPLSVTKTGDNNRNIIMWMDHRAHNETDFINDTGHSQLQFVGGKISIEMQPPKIMWLKKNIPNFMDNIGGMFDLTDYLTFRATGCQIRSICTVGCKWCYDTVLNKWDSSFWKSCDLSEFCENNFAIIGNSIVKPGQLIGDGLTLKAANELGLNKGTFVPAGLIDAYAGLLGSIFDRNQMLSISGTSACHMIISESSEFVTGVWGPYRNVLLDGYFILESGQSAVGNLLDQILRYSGNNLQHSDILSLLLSESSVSQLQIPLPTSVKEVTSYLWKSINQLTTDIHINPDFLGNRSPRSNPNIRAGIFGLGMDTSDRFTAKLYLSTVQAICYGIREILDEFFDKKICPNSVVICGGLAKNEFYTRIFSDVTNIDVYLMPDVDLVLLGTAKLNLMHQHNLDSLMNNKDDYQIIHPDENLKKYHDWKFDIYQKIVKCQTEILQNKPSN